MAPKGSEHLFTEKLWRLKENYTLYRPKPGMGPVGPLPALKNNFITFGTLSRSIRLNDHVIRTWSNILKEVKNSKIIINSKEFKCKKTVAKLKSSFSSYGIAKDRLEIFLESPPWDTMRRIDIALDCFPHNSGTTLIEHLYMGNPFITLASRPSVGRIGATILTATGHTEWIAKTEDEYIKKAVELASDMNRLSDIRSSLREDIQSSVLMNEKLFTVTLEEAYQDMWKKWCLDKAEVTSGTYIA